MTTTDSGPDARRELLCELLLSYLAPDLRAWPGSDGMTVEDVLRDYPSAAAAGRVPGRPELLDQYPDLAAALEEFFTATPGERADDR
jgi:hypothetical protein